jgi:hypothetical protein
MKGTKILVRNAKIADQQLKDFTLEVVNAPDHQVDGSDDYLAMKYRQFVPAWDRDIRVLAEVLSQFRDPNHPDPNNPFFQKDAGQMLCRSVFRELRKRLRSVWLAGDEEAAEWRLFKLEAAIHGATNFEDGRKSRLHPPSPGAPIELVIDWVRRNLLVLRVCPNPECLNPFFVADRAQRRFCLACVSASQKAYKRRWWRKDKGLQEEPKMKAGAKIVPAKRSGGATLESESKWKEFLHDIVNAPENGIDYILKVYAGAGFLPPKTFSERVFAVNPKFTTTEEVRSKRPQEMRQVVERLREGLRSVWSAADQYTARWRLFSLQDEIWGSMDPQNHYLDDVLMPAPSRNQLVYQALHYLRRNLHMLRTCANTACKRPLFIADKGGQAHCSRDCAFPAQREYKARWWREKGPEWRKARRAKSKKSRSPSRKSR